LPFSRDSLPSSRDGLPSSRDIGPDPGQWAGSGNPPAGLLRILV
jgi:hypothetical protein